MPTLESPPGAVVRIDGREYLYFVGTGYLGLQGNSEVIRAACQATARYGLHSATSRAGFGNTPPTLAVERRAAEFFGCEAAFYFSAGYASAGVLLRAVENRFGALFLDEYSHCSVADAARQSGRPTFSFRHRDAGDLADCLRRRLPPGGRPLVMTDGVFSVRGTIAPLVEYRKMLVEYAGSGVLVDDAHGVGVLGCCGRGTLEHFGLLKDVNSCDDVNAGVAFLLCAALSKALGGFGGIIPGSRRFIEQTRSASHWYDGATAPPSPVAAASARALELIEADPEMRVRLWANVAQLKTGLRALGFDVDDTPVPIIYLVVGDAENMQRIEGELMQRGIAVAYKSSYSGVDSSGGLRIAVFATHTPEQIERLISNLQSVL
jgi:7-keto-8-aminopelargonate synthetase-like enzyme